MYSETPPETPAVTPPDESLLPAPMNQPEKQTVEKTTAAQAKVEAIANLTFKAYERAGTLNLTQEESKALFERFPDEAFKPGAGGNEHLIYIEHAFLRDRLNRVLGLGQWCLIPRARWAEDFTYFDKRSGKSATGTRVYVESMLIVRGCFVAEAIGSMDYYPNQATNYGDAVEGATTGSLRRCCKLFGIGLQAWEKDYCDGWWLRKRKGQHGDSLKPTQAPKPPAQPETPEQKKTRWVKACIDAACGKASIPAEYYVDAQLLMPGEEIDDLPADKVPKTLKEANAILSELRIRAGQGQQEHPESESSGESDEPWRAFPIPFGKDKGTPLGEIEKNVLWGWWANYTVEREWKGHPKKPDAIALDEEFRAMLDLAGEHYHFTK